VLELEDGNLVFRRDEICLTVENAVNEACGLGAGDEGDEICTAETVNTIYRSSRPAGRLVLARRINGQHGCYTKALTLTLSRWDLDFCAKCFFQQIPMTLFFVLSAVAHHSHIHSSTQLLYQSQGKLLTVVLNVAITPVEATAIPKFFSIPAAELPPSYYVLLSLIK
jgi:hypothetical protein